MKKRINEQTFNICYEKTHRCSQKIWFNLRFFYRIIVFKIPFKEKKNFSLRNIYDIQVKFSYILQVKINASVVQPSIFV